MNQAIITGKVVKIDERSGETRLTLNVERTFQPNEYDDIEVVVYNGELIDKVTNTLELGNLIGGKCQTIRANGGEQVMEVVMLSILGA